jgi:probable rRNA maturation factor
MPREINIASRHPRLQLDRRAITRAIHLLDTYFTPPPSGKKKSKSRPAAVPEGELSLVFLTDAALAQLHDEFLDDPTTTDVITFEGDPVLGVAGEICVSVDTAAAFAKKSRGDFATELTLYLVHGWLHLAGYDDLKPEKKRLMRRAEKRAMDLLHLHLCHPRLVLRPASR